MTDHPTSSFHAPTMSRRRKLVLCALLAMAPLVQAQTYPSKPITMVVPYGAGGLTDQLARELGTYLSQSMKQPVVVDNKPGGGGQIAMAAVKQAPADGYTLFIADFGPLALNVGLFSKLSYDPRKDLQGVTMLVNAPALLVVPKSSPFNSFSDLVGAAKTRNGGLSYASPGIGSGGHLFGTMLSRQLGAPLTHIAYRGSAPGLTDVMAGQVDFMFDAITTSGAFAKSDKVRALAIGSEKRSPLFPAVPTLKELGYESVVSVPWFGVVVKAGTPDAIADRLNRELVEAMRTPALSKKLLDQGLEIATTTPREFDAHIHAEITKWSKVIRESGMTVD